MDRPSTRSRETSFRRRGLDADHSRGLLGDVGKKPRHWAERLLDECLCHIMATDIHKLKRRAPRLRAGFDAAAKRSGEDEAINLGLAAAIWYFEKGRGSDDATAGRSCGANSA